MPDPSPSSPAWSPPELASPHQQADKPRRVQAMFAAIARSYDLNNRLHSLWQDQAWRRFAVRAAGVRVGDRVLDCACGTGDLTRLFARANGEAAAEVVGLDFTPEMLEVAREKTPGSESSPQKAESSPQSTQRSAEGDAGGKTRVRYIEGDAMSLPFGDAQFDVVSIAFGIRNVSDPAKALREFRRVLKPGGRLAVLEFDRPRVPVLGALSEFYTARIMPVTATLISGDRSGAYTYLPRSVATFLSREQLAAAIKDAGFASVESTPLTFGVCVCHLARV